MDPVSTQRMDTIWASHSRVSIFRLNKSDSGFHFLGFLDLPSGLYPTVGLQTPGEVIDANFGQEPFKFDIEGEMRELRRKTQGVIEDLSWPRKQGDAQAVLHNMVK